MSSRGKIHAAERTQWESRPGKKRCITCILSWLFFCFLISHVFDESRKKKINIHIQWHFCQGVSNIIFEKGSRTTQLHRDLLSQLSQASNSLKIRKQHSPLSTTDGHQIFHKQLKKPAQKAKALFKKPAGTTHRHPAANTSFSRNYPMYTTCQVNTSHTSAGRIWEKVSLSRTKLFACCLQRSTSCAWGLLTLIPQLQATAVEGMHWDHYKTGTTWKYSLSQKKPEASEDFWLLSANFKLSCIPVSCFTIGFNCPVDST